MRALLVAVLVLLPVRGFAYQRVVSLNLCTDQMLVLLAPERVAGLTALARDPTLSVVAAQAAGLPVVRASAEAVLDVAPDLVLGTRWGAQTTLALLQARGVPVRLMDLVEDFAGVRRETRALAALLGVPARGEAMLDAMDRALAGGRTQGVPAPGERALMWAPRGYAAGAGSLGDAVLHAAGLDNARPGGGRVGLEGLLAAPPDLLVVAPPAAFPSLATDLLRHPATLGIARREVPPALTLCASPASARAVDLLRR